MNMEHAVQTIAKRGFTDRQARFLVLVARHSGVCVMRQYSTFAGISRHAHEAAQASEGLTAAPRSRHHEVTKVARR